MAWPVYSERVLAAYLPSVWTVFTVPNEKRLIVQTISLTNRQSVPAEVQVDLHTATLILLAIPARSSVHYANLRHVVYDEETVQVYLNAPNMGAYISGYLFDDPNGNEGPPLTYDPVYDRTPWPETTPLPAAGDELA